MIGRSPGAVSGPPLYFPGVPSAAYETHGPLADANGPVERLLVPAEAAGSVWIVSSPRATRAASAGAFFFDDHASIGDNPHIRRLWPPLGSDVILTMAFIA